MDFSLFASLINNLLQINVFCLHQNADELDYFETHYCFHKKLQPMFTAEALDYITHFMKKETFYEIEDDLGVCLLLFSFENQVFLVGPYVKFQYEDMKMQAILAKNKVPSSFSGTLKLYYTDLPLSGTSHIQNTIFACIRSFAPASGDYSFRRLHGFHETIDSRTLNDESIPSHDDILRRYDTENHFLKMIEAGNVAEVLTAYDEFGLLSIVPTSVKLYQNPLVSLSIVRTLARKAAEASGLSVITIHEITQKSLQSASGSHNVTEQANASRTMVLKLTKAVRNHRFASSHLSPAIEKVVEHLSLHYGQELSLASLAEMVHFSTSHLSRQFKTETGSTLSAYIARLRCDHAAALLRETELSIQEISNYVGYMDNNYFVKVFKKQYGTTPSAFRCS